MKRYLLAAAATSALAFAAPAFAQLGGVTGQVAGSAQVSTAPVTNGAANTVDRTTQGATGAVQHAAPQATGSASGSVQTPVGSAQGSASTSTRPGASTATGAVNNAEQGATNTMRDTNASASASTTTTASAHARRHRGGAHAEGAEQGAVNASLPPQVQDVVTSGHYTTDDLNRAQAAAVQAQTQVGQPPG